MRVTLLCAHDSHLQIRKTCVGTREGGVGHTFACTRYATSPRAFTPHRTAHPPQTHDTSAPHTPHGTRTRTRRSTGQRDNVLARLRVVHGAAHEAQQVVAGRSADLVLDRVVVRRVKLADVDPALALDAAPVVEPLAARKVRRVRVGVEDVTRRAFAGYLGGNVISRIKAGGGH